MLRIVLYCKHELVLLYRKEVIRMPEEKKVYRLKQERMFRTYVLANDNLERMFQTVVRSVLTIQSIVLALMYPKLRGVYLF